MRMRIAALVLLPLLAIGLSTTSASAAVGQRHAGAPYTYTFAAGQACDFPVQWSGIDDTTFVVRPDGSAKTSGYYDATLTNLNTGKHIFRVASGPGVFLAGGKVLRASGRWIIQVPPTNGHKARLVLIDGHFKVGLLSGTVYGATPDTTVTNLCKLIS